jgi:predicted transglutaminase-like cysteine proteinase
MPEYLKQQWYDCPTAITYPAFLSIFRHPLRSFLYALVPIAAAALLIYANLAGAFDSNRLWNAYAKYRGDRPQPFRDWQAMLQENQEGAIPQKLKRVNEFFNRRLQFGEDQQIWLQSDYWATPLETLARGAGDCEDFAIAKYFSLLMLGVPVEQLRLIYVKARIGGPSSQIQQAHMVLAYYATPNDEPMVLDNLITEIRPASRRQDLQPIFSFNSENVFAGAAGNAAAGTGGVGSISRWQELLQRVRAEGFQ